MSHTGSRRVAATFAVVLALGLPWRSHGDVAPPPDGTLTIAAGEACPAAADVTIDELEVEDYGCDITAVQELVLEEETLCTYSLDYDCGGGCG